MLWEIWGRFLVLFILQSICWFNFIVTCCGSHAKSFIMSPTSFFFLVQSHLWLLSSTDRYLILGQYHHCFRTDIWFVFMVRFVGIFQNPIKTMILLIKESSVPSLWKEIKKKLSVAISIIIIIIFYQNYILLYILKKIFTDMKLCWINRVMNLLCFAMLISFLKKKLKLDLY